jgi:hypothetical protein
MQFTFKDLEATYKSTPRGHVEATLKGEAAPSIKADSFLNAKAAVEMRLAAKRKQDMEAAWSQRKGGV